MNKNILIILIISVIVIGAFDLIGRISDSEIIIESGENIEDEIANWETFNHPYYNFKIDFPSDWQGKVNNYIWAPGTIGLSDEVFAFCPSYYDNERCTDAIAPGGPLVIDGPILLFVCVEGSWKVPDEKCGTEEEFSVHYYANIGKPELEEAIKRVNLSYWEGKRRVRAELILFNDAYETIFNNMVSSFKETTTEEVIKVESTKWEKYIFEKITDNVDSLYFMDRKLVGIREDGKKDVIVYSIRDLMEWDQIPKEAGYYPLEVSFPPYSSEIFFVKHIAGSSHSSGLFSLDVNTLEVEELTNIGPIYEDYYNYQSIVSPNGFKVASLGEKLYLLDLLKDKVKILAEPKEGEVFNIGDVISNFVWIDDKNIQFPVFDEDNIYEPPIGLRKVYIGEDSEITDEGN